MLAKGSCKSSSTQIRRALSLVWLDTGDSKLLNRMLNVDVCPENFTLLRAGAYTKSLFRSYGSEHGVLTFWLMALRPLRAWTVKFTTWCR
jgi:hypothetical protein